MRGVWTEIRPKMTERKQGWLRRHSVADVEGNFQKPRFSRTRRFPNRISRNLGKGQSSRGCGKSLSVPPLILSEPGQGLGLGTWVWTAWGGPMFRAEARDISLIYFC